jgi:hypothetical protein
MAWQYGNNVRPVLDAFVQSVNSVITALGDEGAARFYSVLLTLEQEVGKWRFA